MASDQSPPRVVAAACDGACSGNPGPGGWGSLLRFEDGSVQEFGAADPATTNNRMELRAALALLEQLKHLPCHPSLSIRTDSRYLIDGFSKWMTGWKRKGWRTASGSPVLNRDLWEALDRARLAAVPFTYVKGHSGDPDNDRCDAIAVAFSKGGRPALAQAGCPLVAGLGSAAAGAVALGAQARATQTVLAVTTSAEPTSSAKASATKNPTVARPAKGLDPSLDTRSETSPVTSANGGAKKGAKNGAKNRAETGSGAAQPVLAADQAGGQLAGSDPVQESAPAALSQLLSRLELADRLAAGGYGLSLVELAQLVQVPIKQLAEKATPWTWRDWLVLPNADGRWRLERGASGSDPVIPGT